MLLHQHFKLRVVVVAKADAFCLAHAYAVDKAGVHQFVGQHKSARGAHGWQNALIGVVAAAKHKGGLCPVGGGQLGFKGLLLVASSREQAR